MINKESEILHYFAKEPWRKYNFSELKLVSKKKSKSYIASTLEKFVAENILMTQKVGNMLLYSLNLESIKTQVFAGFVLEYNGWNKKHIPYEDLKKIMKKMPTYDYIFLITGSYAKNKQSIDSDIDIVVITDDTFDTKKVYAELSHACEMNIPPMHLYVFKNKEFSQMLISKEANYGKEIIKNNLVLIGSQIYLRIISEVMQNGFNG